MSINFPIQWDPDPVPKQTVTAFIILQPSSRFLNKNCYVYIRYINLQIVVALQGILIVLSHFTIISKEARYNLFSNPDINFTVINLKTKHV